MNNKLNFILIDDSKIDLFLMEKVIKSVYPDCHVLTFDKPDEAIQYFKITLPTENSIVLLDINMPVITGFDFLDIFETIPENQKNFYRIYIITSSVNVTDIERGKSNKNVAQVLQKPLSKEIVLSI